MKKAQKPNKFGKHYLHLCYVFDGLEMAFLLQIIHIQYISSLGYSTDWSKDFLMNRMNMRRTVFDRCEKKLIDMELLEKRSVGKKVCYDWNNDLYEKLVLIVNSSNDIFVVKDFCKKNFITEKRGIAEITDEEIKLLKNAERTNRRY